MQLHCKSCNKPIPAGDVNIGLGIARCLACNAVFNVADEIGRPKKERPTVALPKRFQLDDRGPELVITRRWYTHAVWALVAFCAFWDGFLVVWYTAGIGMLLKGSEGGWMAVLMLAFPVLHVLVGAGLTYLVFCMFVNKTVIRVTTGELTVRHGPLPCSRNSQIFTADLKQLFCTETRRRGEDSCRVTYNLLALKRDNSKLTLISSLEELDQALFIEQQVEQHLKIRDEPVAEEVPV